MILPRRGMILLTLMWAVIGVLSAFWMESAFPWLVFGVLIALGAVLDAAMMLAMGKVEVRRRFSSSFALGAAAPVELEIQNPGRNTKRVRLFDGIPADSSADAMPVTLNLDPRSSTKVEYQLTMRKRGEALFEPAFVLLSSPLRLWWRRIRSGERQVARVFPNYAPVVRYALLATQRRESQTGIIVKTRPGISREFHQIRDYQIGDSLSRIDWKSTARRLQPMSREYSELRDQTVILMIDCGRRMRAWDGDLPQFDHCLNSALMLAYLILRQGDSVGVMTFGGTDVWLPPIKGPHRIQTIIGRLHDLEAGDQPGDFEEAAARVLTRQKKRALVLFLTNLRGEDAQDALNALRSLTAKHLVLVASLREAQIDEQIAEPIESLDQALTFGAARLYFQERQAVRSQLNAAGILTLETTPAALPVDLANRYLDIKAKGTL